MRQAARDVGRVRARLHLVRERGFTLAHASARRGHCAAGAICLANSSGIEEHNDLPRVADLFSAIVHELMNNDCPLSDVDNDEAFQPRYHGFHELGSDE